jgi:hypothetical protein
MDQSMLSSQPRPKVSGKEGIEQTSEVKSPSPFLPGTKVQFAWDSTSIGLLKTCPRLYQYVMLDGYGEGDESIHLRFGIEYHKALEEYDFYRCSGREHDDAVRDSVRDLHTRIWDWDVDRTTRAGKYKNKESLVRSVVWYLDHYRTDVAKTVILDNGRPAVELSFKFELPWGPETGQPDVHDGVSVLQPYLLCGHLDRVVDYDGTMFVMDRKTTQTTLSDYYYAQFDMSNQMSLYTFAGKVVLNSPIKGVCIDAAQLLIDETKFGRSFTYRTPDQTDEWLENLSIWFSMAENFAAANYWPMNDTACDKFGGCKFRGMCSKSPQVRDRFLQSSFKQLPENMRWNPLKPR